MAEIVKGTSKRDVVSGKVSCHSEPKVLLAVECVVTKTSTETRNGESRRVRLRRHASQQRCIHDPPRRSPLLTRESEEVTNESPKPLTMQRILFLSLYLLLTRTCDAFVGSPSVGFRRRRRSSFRVEAVTNEYDQWVSDGVARLSFPVTEENVEECLEILMDSEYGEQMFGRNEKAAAIDITGSVSLVEVEGPEVTLRLEGEACVYVNA